MKIKKLLCLALTLFMVMALVPTTVFATTPTQGAPTTHELTEMDKTMAEQGYFFRKGDGSNGESDYYKVLWAAVSACYNVGGTVTQIADVTKSENLVNANGNAAHSGQDLSASTKQLVIDGNGFSITSEAYWLFRPHTGDSDDSTVDFVFKNMTVNGAGLLKFYGLNSNINVLVENCTLNSSAWSCILMQAAGSTNSYNGNLTVKNSKLTVQNTAVTAKDVYGMLSPISVQGSNNWTVNVDNSTLTNESGYTGDAFAGSVINAKKRAAENTTALNGKTVNINLTNGTKLVAKTATPSQYAIVGDFAGTMNVTMDDSVSLELASAGATANGFIYKGSNMSTMSVKDDGATCVACAEAVKVGVSVSNLLPTTISGRAYTGWTVGETLVAVGEAYTDAEATEAATFVGVLSETTQGSSYGTHVLTEEDKAKAAEGYYFRRVEGGETTYYKILWDAVKGTWGKGGVVTQIADATTYDAFAAAGNEKHIGQNTNASDGAGLVIDGNGFKLQDSGIRYLVTINAIDSDATNVDVTFKNMTVIGPGLFRYNRTSDNPVNIVVENCTVISSHACCIYMHYGNYGAQEGTLTVRNSVLNVANTANDDSLLHDNKPQVSGMLSPISIQGAYLWNINVDNSTLTNESGYTGTNFAGSVINAKNTSASPTALDGKTVNINLTNGTKLVAKTATPSQYAIVGDFAGTMNVTMDNSVALEVASAGTTANGFIYSGSNMSSMSVKDNSATYTACAEAVKAGVTVSNMLVTTANGSKVLGWDASDGGKAAVKTAYVNADATEAVGFTASVTMDENDFFMKTGAAVRTAAPTGLRFAVKVSKELVDNLAALGIKATYSTMLAPNSYVEASDSFTLGGMTYNNDYVTATKTSMDDITLENGYYTYYATLIDIPINATGVDMEFAARGYLTLKTESGEDIDIFYTEFSETDHVRSMAYVANYFITANPTEYGDNEILKQIVAASAVYGSTN